MILDQVCKAISIRLIEDEEVSQPQSSIHDSTIHDSNYEPCLFWSPRPPEADEMKRITTTEPLQRTDCFSIHLHMTFGGPSGSRLRHLSRVVALMDGDTGFHGIAFSYDDGVEELHGRRVVIDSFGRLRCCVEQSFPLNGAAGERITGFRGSFRDCNTTGRKIMRSLKVRTFLGCQGTPLRVAGSALFWTGR